MKLSAKKQVLQVIGEKAGRIVGGCSRDLAPVYKNFQFELRKEPKSSLRIVATDMDLSVIGRTELVEVMEPGIAIIPAKKFLEIIKEAGEGDISIEAKDDSCVIENASSKWNLQLMKEQYPPIPDPANMEWHKINAGVLYKSLNKVRSASGKDNIRPELTVIRVDSTGVYASDGARMHFAREAGLLTISLEIPIGAVDELTKILRFAGDTKINVGQTTNQILFEIGNDIFMCTKLNAKFPIEHISAQIESVRENKQQLQLNRDELITAIKRCRITADEETNIIMLNLLGNILTVSTRDKQNNSATETMQVSWGLEPKSICLNWMFLQDAIGEMESPNIRLMFGQDKGQRKAPVAVEEPNFLSVLNQLRLLDETKTPAVANPSK